MEHIFQSIKLKVHESLYLKDPESSDLGRSLISKAIEMLDEIGIEDFNFKKLACEVGTTESTIYRYFENKYKLLLYLINWYWSWLEYVIVFNTANIGDPKLKLKKGIDVLALGAKYEAPNNYMDMNRLFHLVNLESHKIFRVTNIDRENEKGFFAIYKRLCHRIADNIREINPHYKMSKTLASLVMDAIHHQKFYSEKLPSLTDLDHANEDLSAFIYDMTLAILHKDKSK